MNPKDGGDVCRHEKLKINLDPQFLSRRDCVTRRPCGIAHPSLLGHGGNYIVEWLQ